MFILRTKSPPDRIWLLLPAALLLKDKASQKPARETTAKAKPAIQWLLRKFNVDLEPTLRAFKAERMVCPTQAQSMALTREKLQCIEAFTFVTPDDLRVIGDELPTYLAVIADVEIADSSEILVWGVPTATSAYLELRTEDSAGATNLCGS